MLALAIAWRQCRSLWSSGEIRVLLFALILAVTATTSVSFFTERIQAGMQTQGNVLLGADLVVNADHDIPASYQAEAQQRQLQTTLTLEFPSMVVRGERSQLAEIKAVEAGFPLRGQLTISKSASHKELATAVPAQGTVWIEPSLANKLALNIGDDINIGDSQFKVAALLMLEPSRGGDMFSIAPRVLMHGADVPATGLIQFGSRVKYQLLVASRASVGQAATQAYADWLTPRLARGERIDDVRSARPEMRNALEKAQQFLGIASVVGVILAMVAMLLASMPYVQKSLDTYALMRCFGATKQLITQILLYQTLLLALVGSVIGCVLGFVAQYGLSLLAERLFMETLPAPGGMPVILGFVTGFATLLTVVWPQLMRLQAVPALRILRQDLEGNVRSNGLVFLPAFLVLAGLVFWHSGNLKLAGIVLAALLALVAVASGLALAGMCFIRSLPVQSLGAARHAGMIKLGLLGLSRRPVLTIAQVVGLSMGLMAVLLLATVRNDLLSSWQTSLPADAPNRFVINIQPDQIPAIHTLLTAQGMTHADIFPMVRARLEAVNGKPINVADYSDDRAKRLAEREFNLSWAAQMQADNTLVAGQWWRAADAGQPWLSLEHKLAESLKLTLGDQLTFDVAGTKLRLKVTNLRKVEWSSMHVNFFAVTPPGVLDHYAANHVTSFHLPAGQEEALNRLIKQFPNLTIINVSAMMVQIQGLISKMSYAIEFVFGFSLLAGVAVLYAAMMATREERVRESTLMRVLGASRRQVVTAMLVEFLCIGLLASIVASLFTHLAAHYLASLILDIHYQFNAWRMLQALLVASVLVPLAAWLVVRKQLNQAPRVLLQSV